MSKCAESMDLSSTLFCVTAKGGNHLKNKREITLVITLKNKREITLVITLTNKGRSLW